MSSDALEGRLCRLRPYRIGDAEALCAVADDYLVARWMSRRFPNPYTRADADLWLSVAASRPDQSLVIEVDGVLAGGVGVEPLEGEREGTALFGYWLGRAYWGRGIGTDAARMVSERALASGLRRLEASVFAQNIASARVLEKSGFTLEARLRAWYLDRERRVCDALLFARLA